MQTINFLKKRKNVVDLYTLILNFPFLALSLAPSTLFLGIGSISIVIFSE